MYSVYRQKKPIVMLKHVITIAIMLTAILCVICEKSHGLKYLIIQVYEIGKDEIIRKNELVKTIIQKWRSHLRNLKCFNKWESYHMSYS